MKDTFYKNIIELDKILDDLQNILYDYQLSGLNGSCSLKNFRMEDIINYLRDNDMVIDDIFGRQEIIDYIEDHFEINDLYDNEDVLEYVRNEWDVEDIVEFSWNYYV